MILDAPEIWMEISFSCLHWRFSFWISSSPALKSQHKQTIKTPTPRISLFPNVNWRRNIFEVLQLGIFTYLINLNDPEGRCCSHWFCGAGSCPWQRLRDLLGILHPENGRASVIGTNRYLWSFFQQWRLALEFALTTIFHNKHMKKAGKPESFKMKLSSLVKCSIVIWVLKPFASVAYFIINS